MKKIKSIFKVLHYSARPIHGKNRQTYPTFKVNGDKAVYFATIDEVESHIQEIAHYNYGIYAYVVLEFPLGIEVNECLDQYLSVRIYLPDGTLWGQSQYANFFPTSISTPDDYNYWGKRNQFWGRAPEEIKFKPGDIVEILGYPGNPYWSNDEVNLAIIVKTPPTIDEVDGMREEYYKIHSGSDLCDHALSTEFNYHMDTYQVLSMVCDELDHAPTISVFKPTRKVPDRKKEALLRLYESYRNRGMIL